MTQPAQAVRVIYAKLTSTGDYDVVAKTDNIDLNAARSLAEKLLLGNVPHEATIGEELAYLRPPEGGHLLIRYTTYNWKDENRGGAFMTDVAWLNDNEFARARRNPFAVMPKSDDVYDVLATLPPVDIPVRTAVQDFERLEQLGEAKAALSVLAPVLLRGQPVLSVDSDDPRGRLELFTLLLPPSLRPMLTFQTRAFRVAAYPPRVTFADTLHANLQNGPWAHVLPDRNLDVPFDLARRLIAATDHPEVLAVAQQLFEESGRPSTDMRAEVTRLVDLIDFAQALDSGDATNALRLAATSNVAESEARIAEVFRRAAPADIRKAVLDSVSKGGAAEAQAERLLVAMAKADPATAAQLENDAARQLISASRMPGTELATHLVGALATAGNAETLILLLGLDPEGAASLIPASTDNTALGTFLQALHNAARNRRDVGTARRLIPPATALALQIRDASAVSKLALLCRGAVESALEKLTLRADDVGEVRALQDAADLMLGSAPSMKEAVPQIFSDAQLAALTPAALTDAVNRRADRLAPDAIGVIAASLVLRSAQDTGTGEATSERRLTAARALLTSLQPPLRVRVQGALEELGVSADALLGMKGGDALLPVLGRNTEQVASTRDLVQAVRDIGESDEAAGRLALAALAGRNGQLLITRAHQAFAPLKNALSASMNQRRASGSYAPVLELTLDLLAMLTDAEAFAELEAAALAHGGVTVRLRRLDRAVALCRAAEDEVAYEQLALAIESPETPITDASRQRLREALGTGGLQRRLIQMITGVVERNAQ